MRPSGPRPPPRVQPHRWCEHAGARVLHGPAWPGRGLWLPLLGSWSRRDLDRRASRLMIAGGVGCPHYPPAARGAAGGTLRPPSCQPRAGGRVLSTRPAGVSGQPREEWPLEPLLVGPWAGGERPGTVPPLPAPEGILPWLGPRPPTCTSTSLAVGIYVPPVRLDGPWVRYGVPIRTLGGPRGVGSTPGPRRHPTVVGA